MAFLMIVHVPFIEDEKRHKENTEHPADESENIKNLSPVTEEESSPSDGLNEDNKASIPTENDDSEGTNDSAKATEKKSTDECKQDLNDKSNAADGSDVAQIKDGEEANKATDNTETFEEKAPASIAASEVNESSPEIVDDGKQVDNVESNHVGNQKKEDDTSTPNTNEGTELNIPKTADTDEPNTEIETTEDQTSQGIVTPTTPKDAVPFIDKIPLHKEVEGILTGDGNVRNLERAVVGDGSIMRFSFVEEDSKNCENILNMLKSIGVGYSMDTSISVFPCSVHESGSGSINTSASSKSIEDMDDRDETLQDAQKESVFKKSIKSRLVVAQVVASVRNNALFTFDYLLLLLLASVIACVGLAENSSVVLVASMLISPLMGPILAGTFGQIVNMKDLRNLGIRSELVGLLLCLLVGFLFGLITGGFGLQGAVWGSSDQWPTPEMKSRGLLRSLGIGILIALPSGAGVAISVLSANTGSLVGVAISASLLPPACNAGMLWGYSLLAAFSPPAVKAVTLPTTLSTTTTTATIVSGIVNNITNSSFPESTNTTSIPFMTTTPGPYLDTSDCPALVNNAYTPVYSCNLAVDAALLGLVSLFLTILNIICIFFIGLLFLWIKEVAPHTAGKEKPTDHFWHEDIKVARTYYQTSKGQHSTQLGKQFLDEWKKIKQSKNKQEIDRKDSMVERAETLEMCQHLMGVQNSPDMQNVLSKLHTPTTNLMDDLLQECDEAKYQLEDQIAKLKLIQKILRQKEKMLNLMDDLLQEYDEAKYRLEEQIAKHPTFLFANTMVKSNDKKFMRAYNTLSVAAPQEEKPSIFEMRNRFRKMGGVQSMYIKTEDETSPSVSFLSAPGDSLLGRKRRQKKEKAVKFQVEKVDEVEEPLIP